MQELKVVTRSSPLAIRQTELVMERLKQFYPDLKITLYPIRTIGDDNLADTLEKIGGKGLFTQELQEYLLEKKADIAVHSMKDVPLEPIPGLAIPIILERTHLHDIFITKEGLNVHDMPANFSLGTASLRRQGQIYHMRKDVVAVPLRGNINTRLDKLNSGELDAIILAQAGIERLKCELPGHQLLSLEDMLPAAAQGALGIELLQDNQQVIDLLAPLHCQRTSDEVAAERAMNRYLNGGCFSPIAALAYIEDDILHLTGRVIDPRGDLIYENKQYRPIAKAEELGIEVARNLLAQGAGKILNLNKK